MADYLPLDTKLSASGSKATTSDRAFTTFQTISQLPFLSTDVVVRDQRICPDFGHTIEQAPCSVHRLGAFELAPVVDAVQDESSFAPRDRSNPTHLSF